MIIVFLSSCFSHSLQLPLGAFLRINYEHPFSLWLSFCRLWQHDKFLDNLLADRAAGHTLKNDFIFRLWIAFAIIDKTSKDRQYTDLGLKLSNSML